MKCRRYKLWWSGNSDCTGGVGVLVKEEMCEKVMEMRRKIDRVMTVVMVLEEEVLRMCVWSTEWLQRKNIFIIIIIINLLSAISQWFNGALQFKLKK